jgi:flagellar motor switch protein FliN/FliY
MEIAPNLQETLLEALRAAASTLGLAGEPAPIASGWVAPAGATVIAGTVQGGPGGQIAVIAEGDPAGGIDTLGQALDAAAVAVLTAIGAEGLGEPVGMELHNPAAVGAQISDGTVTVSLVYAVSAVAPSASGPRPVANDPFRRLHDVEMLVTAELGRAQLSVRELLGLVPGTVVELDRVAGSPIDLLVNGKLVARGEVVVIDEEFGVRITEIVGDEA